MPGSLMIRLLWTDQAHEKQAALAVCCPPNQLVLPWSVIASSQSNTNFGFIVLCCCKNNVQYAWCVLACPPCQLDIIIMGKYFRPTPVCSL